MINKLKYSKFNINLSWLLFDKIFRASANIFLSIFLARNLGPENFGILNYFLAFLFLFSSISAFGINTVLVNQILKTKKNIKYNSIISSYYFRFILSLINYIIFILLIGILNENQKALLGSYVSSFEDNGIDFKIFLNEEIGRIKNELTSASTSSAFLSDKTLKEKLETVYTILDKTKEKPIDTETIELVLNAQQLIEDINKDEN